MNNNTKGCFGDQLFVDYDPESCISIHVDYAEIVDYQSKSLDEYVNEFTDIKKETFECEMIKHVPPNVSSIGQEKNLQDIYNNVDTKQDMEIYESFEQSLNEDVNFFINVKQELCENEGIIYLPLNESYSTSGNNLLDTDNNVVKHEMEFYEPFEQNVSDGSENLITQMDGTIKVSTEDNFISNSNFNLPLLTQNGSSSYYGNEQALSEVFVKTSPTSFIFNENVNDFVSINEETINSEDIKYIPSTSEKNLHDTFINVHNLKEVYESTITQIRPQENILNVSNNNSQPLQTHNAQSSKDENYQGFTEICVKTSPQRPMLTKPCYSQDCLVLKPGSYTWKGYSGLHMNSTEVVSELPSFEPELNSNLTTNRRAKQEISFISNINDSLPPSVAGSQELFASNMEIPTNYFLHQSSNSSIVDAGPLECEVYGPSGMVSVGSPAMKKRSVKEKGRRREKERRMELAMQRENLRRLLPRINKIERIPTLTVLTTAREYCLNLELKFNELEAEKLEQIRKHETLVWILTTIKFQIKLRKVLQELCFKLQNQPDELREVKLLEKRRNETFALRLARLKYELNQG